MESETILTNYNNELIKLKTGFKMFMNELDSPSLRINRIRDKAELKFIKSFVKSDMICVDIGANIGYYTLILSSFAKHVYAFEPETRNYNTLLKNIELNNRTENVTVYPYAVGKSIKDIELYKCGTRSGMHRIYPSKQCNAGTETVHMVTLDSIIDHADFIKMDIEGSEFGALLGMRKILEKGCCTLMMEFHVPSIIEYGTKNPVHIYKYISNLGYNIRFVDKRPLPDWETLSYRTTKHSGINIICTPKK